MANSILIQITLISKKVLNKSTRNRRLQNEVSIRATWRAVRRCRLTQPTILTPQRTGVCRSIRRSDMVMLASMKLKGTILTKVIVMVQHFGTNFSEKRTKLKIGLKSIKKMTRTDVISKKCRKMKIKQIHLVSITVYRAYEITIGGSLSLTWVNARA